MDDSRGQPLELGTSGFKFALLSHQTCGTSGKVTRLSLSLSFQEMEWSVTNAPPGPL